MIERFADDRVYLDRNVFIYAVEGFPKYEVVARQLVTEVDGGRLHAVTSELTLAEVLVNPIRHNRSNIVRAFETALQTRATFEVIPISRSILRSSATLRASNGGKLADAIHCATALWMQCRYLLTADRAFKITQGLELVLLDDLLPKSNG